MGEVQRVARVAVLFAGLAPPALVLCFNSIKLREDKEQRKRKGADELQLKVSAGLLQGKAKPLHTHTHTHTNKHTHTHTHTHTHAHTHAQQLQI